MKELLKHILEDGWTLFMSVRIDGEKVNIFHHENSKFSLWITNSKFQFKSHWKMIRFSTDWIKFHSIEHFEIFDKQARQLDAWMIKYLTD